MRVRTRVLEPGTAVRIRRPRPGLAEQGTWRVAGRARTRNLDDLAYELRNERTGRTRVIPRSRLAVRRGGGDAA